MSRAWSREEVEATVADYFHMLTLQLAGQQYNKTTHRREVLQKLDDGKNVHYLDIGHRFLNSDGILPATIMPDYLHLSKQGYEIWAESIEPQLAELLGEKK